MSVVRDSVLDALRTELAYEDLRIEKGRPPRAGIGISPFALREVMGSVDGLWEIIGCAEAYFAAETDDEAATAEREFYALLAVARAE